MERLRMRKFPIVKDLIKELDLIPLLEVNVDVEIKTQSVYRVGYELIGFFSEGEELQTNVNVLGKKEIKYLEGLDINKR
ncbi:MAG: serine kinase, partial [Cetobacterium sp.]